MFTLKNFYNNKEYAKGVEYGSNPDNRKDFNEWDYLFYSKCLYKLGSYEEILVLYKEFHELFPESDKLNNNMGWSLYHARLKTFNFKTDDIKKYLSQIDYIIKNCNDDQYSPRSFILMHVIDAIFKKKIAANINYELSNKYLSLIDQSKLSDKESEREENWEIKKCESDKEKWYRMKIKTLLNLKKYHECIKYADESFEEVTKFHDSNFYWVNCWKAKSYLYLGQYDIAKEVINSILKSLNHWVLYYALFEIYANQGEIENALRVACIGALNGNDYKVEVSFFNDFAYFLFKNAYVREAALHYKLIEIIRSEESWKKIKLPNDFSYPEDIVSMDKQTILNNLKKFWHQEKNRGLEFFEGTIIKILPNDKSGFIEDTLGNSYYFNIRDFVKKINSLTIGLRVRFTLAERMDKKKNEIKKNAVEISII